MWNSWVRLVAVSAAVCLCAGAVFGQTVQVGKITGTVTDPNDERMPAAEIVVSSNALISGERSVTSSDNGSFILLNLPPGEYELNVTAQGFKTYSQTGIEVQAGSVITLDVRMEMGVVGELLMVTAAPILDIKNSTVLTRFSGEILEKIPTQRDAFYDLALTAPGMAPVGAVADEGWLNSPSAYGGATSENMFLVNGVNATNPRGSSYGPLVSVNYDAVEEVRIISLGTKAEYGSFSGVAIDVLTKSGGPEIEGSGAFYTVFDVGDNQPAGTDAFGRDFLFSNPGEDLVTKLDSSDEWNVSLGGPLVKNKLWFYTGFLHTASDTKQPFWPHLLGYEADLFDLKLTAEPADGHYAWISYHTEDNGNTNGTWVNTWDPTMYYDAGTKNDTLSAQWQWLPTSRAILSLKYLGFETDLTPSIPTSPSNPGIVNWWKWGQFGVAGAFPYIEGAEAERKTIQADVSYFAEDFLGQHDLKFGVQYTQGEGNSVSGYFHGYGLWAYPNRWTYSVQYMQDWYGDTGLRFYVNQRNINPFLTVRESDSTGVFVDDQWLVNDRLTLNLGLRYDEMKAGYGQGAVYELLATPDEINNPTVLRTREGGDVFDFTTWSPRLGVTYLLTEDGKNLLKVAAGRYYAPITLENLRRFGPDMPLSHNLTLQYAVPWAIADADGDGFISYDNMVAAAREIPNLTPLSIQDHGLEDDSWALKVAPGTKDAHTDQFTVSFARELAPHFGLEATYIYKNTKDLIVNWPINRQTQEPWQWERVPYTAGNGETYLVYSIALLDYNGDGVTDVQDAVWVMENHDFEARNLGTVDGLPGEREYQGLQLVFNKRLHNRWQMTGSILYSDSDGVVPRTLDQQWYIDGPMVHDTPFVNSPNQLVNNMEGPLMMLPEYSLKMAGSYTIPKIETDLGFRLRFNEGRPIWPVEVVPQFATWMSSYDPSSMILSTGGETGGAIVARDPNAPDHLPDSTIVDLSLNREFSLGGDMDLSVSLDALNVFNEDAVNDADWRAGSYGRVFALERPRMYRLGVRFGF
jgi:outer membrane receptor protein involved in Fe transport